jgi:shikimate kinase / 3-dehydroquinate synthase
VATVGERPRGAFVVIGFMGAGKSTLAAELARGLGVTPRDSDELLETRLGHSIAEEFERGSFREREEQLVCELLADAEPGDVISLGGGSVLSERVRRALEGHVVVLLDVAAEEAWQRVSAQNGGAERPLARDHDAFVALHEEREELYERLADAHLPQLPPGAAVRSIGALRALSEAAPGTRLVWASSSSGAYPVFVGRGILSAAEQRHVVRAAGIDSERSRAFCVSDENVARLYAQRLEGLTGTFTLTPGEQHKTLQSAEAVWQALVDARIGKADHLIALGGGVVGDLAGFCAATYQRGIAVVHVPTTLLAQVDSAYGGKTGVDLPRAKNYVGAYHQPAAVLADVDVLATLPPGELAAGWVEVLKTALIGGGRLWASVAAGSEVDESTIVECARVKLAIVAEDERDAGRRQLLNLGHTVGHAIEAATSYTRYRHGEAVGLGLLAALRLAGAEELRSQVRELLQAHGLPVQLRGAAVEDVLDAVGLDKKRTSDGVPFVLAAAPGAVTLEEAVAPDEVRAAVAELAR